MLDREDLDRLREIREEIRDLTDEAERLLKHAQAREIARRADAYCLGQIGRALGEDTTTDGFDPAGYSFDALIEDVETEVGQIEAEADPLGAIREDEAVERQAMDRRSA